MEIEAHTSLTDEQKSASESEERSILVVAGPGTGKTRTLTHRFEFLVNKKGIDPSEILTVTYTDKATKEMRNRIRKLIPFEKRKKGTQISTFHSFCIAVLEEKYPSKKIDIAYVFKRASEIFKDNKFPGFKEQTDFFGELKRIEVWEKRDFNQSDIIEILGNYLNYGEEKLLESFEEEKVRQAYKEYNSNKEEMGAWDFFDLIIETYKLFREESQELEKWKNRFKAVLFDEFQDIDEIQLEILKMLHKPDSYFFCVGDPDQSIYGFRGAVPQIFEKFTETFPNTVSYNLTVNFRCTPSIQEVANILIEKNPSKFRKHIITHKKIGDEVDHLIFENYKEEHNWVIQKIKELQDKEVSLDDIAILYRTGRGSKKIEELQINLKGSNITFLEGDDYKKLKRTEIRDMIAWAVIGLGKDQRKIDNAMRRVINKPTTGIGFKTRRKIEDFMMENKYSFEQAVFEYPTQKLTHFTNSVEDIRRLWKDPNKNIKEKVEDLFRRSAILEYFKRKGEIERYERMKEMIEHEILENWDINEKHVEEIMESLAEEDVGRESVFVDTIHQSKGLEWKYVFVIGLNKNDFPFKRSVEEGEMDEERRIAYVAITRGEKKLWLTSCKGGEFVSMFCDEIAQKINSVEIS